MYLSFRLIATDFIFWKDLKGVVAGTSKRYIYIYTESNYSIVCSIHHSKSKEPFRRHPKKDACMEKDSYPPKKAHVPDQVLRQMTSLTMVANVCGPT